MHGKREFVWAEGVVAALAILITIILIAIPNASGEETNLHLNMKDGNLLAPETVGDPEHEGEIQRVDAVYQENIIGRSNREWVDVGTWTSDPVDSSFRITDERMEFNIWFKVMDTGYSADPDWEFALLLNDVEHAITQVSDSDESTEEPIEVVAVLFPEELTVGEGDTLGLHIRYRAWEDCDVYFDCASYDSGVEVNSDFMEVFSIEAKGDAVQVEVYDPFDTNWNEAISWVVLTIDDEERNAIDIQIGEGDEHGVGGATVTGTLIEWTFEDSFSGGEVIEAWVKYTDCSSTEERGLICDCTAKSDQLYHPVAGIRSISPNPVEEGGDVTFDGRDSDDEDGDVVRYVWTSDIDGEFYNGTSSKITFKDLSVENHTITLKVQDDDGLWSEGAIDEVSVTERPNTAPEITLLFPADGLIVIDPFMVGDIDAAWEGTDADGDDLTYDVTTGSEPDLEAGRATSDSTSAWLLYMALEEEERTFYWMVTVSDGRVNVSSDVRSITIISDDSSLVRIDAPVQLEQVSGMVTVNGTAGPEDGFHWNETIDHVEISYDGRQWLNVTGTDEWSFTWDTRNVENGLYTISVRIFDGVWYTTHVEVQVYVVNEGGDGEDDDEDSDDETGEFLFYGGLVGGVIAVIVVVGILMRPGRGYEHARYDEEEYDYDEYDEGGNEDW